MTPIEKLSQYHKSEKIRDGISYIAKPQAVEPAPEVPDPLLIAQMQLAKSYWDWAQALKNL